MLDIKNYRVLLASQSPRRQELLKGLDIPFSTTKIAVEEVFPPDLKAELVAKFLAEKKAKACYPADNEIWITADTVVLRDNQVLEKPQNVQEAAAMLSFLSNKMHSVFTGVVLKTKETSVVFDVESKVWFSELSNQEIEYYTAKYQPFDKAGAYGIQEWLGYVAVDRIEGCYYNIMGLPVSRLYKELKKLLIEIAI